MVTLPTKYAWLLEEPAPKILLAALQLYGTREIVGPQHSAAILSWARELKMSRDYTMDETPWCGLFVAICAERAGYEPAAIALRAKDWLNWGVKVAAPALGDVVVFGRAGGGHVGLYVGETLQHYAILGGNQGNCVCIALLEKERALGYRRSPFKLGTPANVRRINLSQTRIPISTNEA